MSNIDLQTVKFRKSGLSQYSDEPFESSSDIKSESSCYYEADCSASHIINRQRIGKRDGIENPGLEEVWNREIERRKQLNMSVISKSLSQGRMNDETESHYKFDKMFTIKCCNDINNPVITDEGLRKAVEAVYYPAESLEGSQWIKAVDISMHLPDCAMGSISETLRRNIDETLTDLDTTIVDENLALNSSIHYSQVLCKL